MSAVHQLKPAALVVLLAMLLAACGGSATAERPPDTPRPASPVDTSVPDAGGPAYSEDLIAEGDKLYHQTCFACHGPDATGVEGLGKDLTTSQFFADSTDEQLLQYVLEGRTIDDPANTSGVAMPPKGGFVFLQNEDILAIIAYLRTLQQ